MKGLYVHIPFCVKKCNYCDFASFRYKGTEAEEKYTDALLREFESIRCDEPVDTVYIGGGTPTVLSNRGLCKVLDGIRSNFNITDNAEFTIEANPLTVSIDTCRILKEYGVNRVSMGIQSANDEELKFLGRIHTWEQAVDTYKLLRDNGIENINCDLMFGLPGQSMASLELSVKKILDLNPEHISCYGLKIEEDTPFYKMMLSGELEETEEDLFADMYDLVRSNMYDRGMVQYEISNFSKKGYESQHNIRYWTQREYYGTGLGASSFIDNVRYTNTVNFNEYVNHTGHVPAAEKIAMSRDDLMSEYMILGLRLTQRGVIKNAFSEKFGVSAEDIFKQPIEKYVKTGFINSTHEKIVLNEKAYYVSNSILCDFII